MLCFFFVSGWKKNCQRERAINFQPFSPAGNRHTTRHHVQYYGFTADYCEMETVGFFFSQSKLAAVVLKSVHIILLHYALIAALIISPQNDFWLLCIYNNGFLPLIWPKMRPSLNWLAFAVKCSRYLKKSLKGFVINVWMIRLFPPCVENPPRPTSWGVFNHAMCKCGGCHIAALAMGAVQIWGF